MSSAQSCFIKIKSQPNLKKTRVMASAPIHPHTNKNDNRINYGNAMHHTFESMNFLFNSTDVSDDEESEAALYPIDEDE